MAKKYKFFRVPEEVYSTYYNIKVKMEKDLKEVSGKNIKMSMPKVLKAIASPDFNENFIDINLHNLLKLAKGKKR